ncbi:MAG: ATP-binding cassette domain-containing protein [Elusimicrobiota bacterium]|nr:ATP-binding cassette domain-containing protein [Elusimicrobiota bacterium]
MAVKIELKDLSFAYEGGEDIVRSASFSVSPGEVLAVVAPVGAGKTTLLKLCAGLLPPTGGSLLVDGKNFWELSAGGQLELRHRMGFSFQEAALVANMNVFDNLALPLRYYGDLAESEIESSINAWLGRLNLGAAGKSLPAALSSGVRQKVSFIRTALLGRDFLFWDSPTQDADDAFISLLGDEIQEQKKKGVGQLLTTQSRGLLFRSADRVLTLDGGKIGYLGPLKGAGTLAGLPGGRDL